MDWEQHWFRNVGKYLPIPPIFILLISYMETFIIIKSQPNLQKIDLATFNNKYMNEIRIKLGVIIQGPLISFGQGPNDSTGGFDTFDTIIKNSTQLNGKGFYYIVSTWSPSNVQEQHIIDALRDANVNVTHISSPKIFDPDHRYKQHYGVLRGAKALLEIEGDITHFVKIRTDMLMPEEFWEWAYTVSEKNEKKLYVSELMNRPYYQGDFIYLAVRDIFLSYLTAVVSYQGHIIHPCIAFDMGLKHCEACKFGFLYGHGFFGHIRFLLDFIFRTGFVRKQWNQFINKHIGIMPETVWLDIKWRNRRVGSFLESTWFKFDNSEITQDISFRDNIKNLIREYKIYRKKCRKSRMNQL